MHKLLRRQLKRSTNSQTLTSEMRDNLEPLWLEVSEAYTDFDKERLLLERSLELVSDELNERNRELKNRIQQLETTHQQLDDSISVLDGIFNATGEAILAFDSRGRLVRFNQSAQHMLRLASGDEIYGNQKVMLNFGRMLKNYSEFQRQVKQLNTEPEANLFGVLELKDKQLFEYHSIAQLSNGELIGRVWCFRNVTTIKENEALIQYQAFHDALTGLPNRILLLDRIKHAAELCQRTDNMLAVLFIDLDHFKKVNDTEGHQVGDELLIQVAKRIRSCMREHDTLARFGGDEFVVLLENIKNHTVASQTSARIIEQLKVPFTIAENEFHIAASIGISMYPQDDTESQELIRKSDLAMYHAKENGRGHFEFFDAALEKLAHYQIELENRLRLSIVNDELEVYYQPQVNTKTLRVNRVEALLRWYPKNSRPIAPSDFIPIAERAGLICEIGHWVFEQVCLQIEHWRQSGLEDICVAVNLSARQISEIDFVSQVKELMQRYQIPGRCLEFEITESILVEDLEMVKQVLEELRKIKISTAIDDFGTGYSSLQYLQQLPIDQIKIDRSFVSDLIDSPGNQSIVNAIISLGHNLNLQVVAEGVETAEVVDYLSQRQCEFIQGYYFYRPMPSKQLTEILTASRDSLYLSSGQNTD